jgi:hypothetical protein
MDGESFKNTRYFSFFNPEFFSALDFRSVTMSQYSEAGVHRELSKAYVSFMSEQEHPSPIATGNWGCGVFKGDAPLKAIIQLLAASQGKKFSEFIQYILNLLESPFALVLVY